MKSHGIVHKSKLFNVNIYLYYVINFSNIMITHLMKLMLHYTKIDCIKNMKDYENC